MEMVVQCETRFLFCPQPTALSTAQSILPIAASSPFISPHHRFLTYRIPTHCWGPFKRVEGRGENGGASGKHFGGRTKHEEKGTESGRGRTTTRPECTQFGGASPSFSSPSVVTASDFRLFGGAPPKSNPSLNWRPWQSPTIPSKSPHPTPNRLCADCGSLSPAKCHQNPGESRQAAFRRKASSSAPPFPAPHPQKANQLNKIIPARTRKCPQSGG